MSTKTVVTIARQYGSGGREIGVRLSELLGIPIYDRELITMAAQAGDLHPDVAEKADEKAANSLLYTLAMGSNIYSVAHAGGYALPLNDRLFILQSDVIRSLADKGGGIIVGRCADYVLRENPRRFSVFIYAPLVARQARVCARHPELTESAALDLINKTDRRRASYYNFYTGGRWGRYDNYRLALDSSALGIEGTAALLAKAVRDFEAHIAEKKSAEL